MTTIFLLALTAGIATAAWAARSYKKKANRYLEHLPRHVWNSISLQKLIASPVPLPPPTGWAADSDILSELSRFIYLNNPKVVVELGSGLSTLVIAATLKLNGRGRLVSIDHSAEYAHATSELLELTGLSDFVDLQVCPLTEQQAPSNSSTWYDLTVGLLPKTVDLVFVDGPPAAEGANIRAPAIEYFWPRLGAGGAIVFDDAERRDERNFLKRWLATNPDASLTRPITLKGCAVISRSLQ